MAEGKLNTHFVFVSSVPVEMLLFYILTIAGIFILRKTKPDVERPYKAFGYPVLPMLYIVLAAAICIDLLIFKPNYTYPGLFIVLLGVPVYFLWKRKSEP